MSSCSSLHVTGLVGSLADLRICLFVCNFLLTDVIAARAQADELFTHILTCPTSSCCGHAFVVLLLITAEERAKLPGTSRCH
jgi:hypothetical protein